MVDTMAMQCYNVLSIGGRKLTKQETIPALKLSEFMGKNNLSKECVADDTHSHVRSVNRWLHTGIPVLKWELLQAKVK
jgi:hypothetical protein